MNYLAVLSEITNYYINLLIVQYHNKPKARATVELIANLIWMNMIIFQIRDAFDWRSAVGKQLDIIADWVGLNRFYDGKWIFTRPWFSLIDWDSTPNNLQGGFSTFSNFEELKGGILDYDEINPSQNSLSDDDFRLLIGLKIIKNSINFTAKNIDDAIWSYFGNTYYSNESIFEGTVLYTDKHYANAYGTVKSFSSNHIVIADSNNPSIVLYDGYYNLKSGTNSFVYNLGKVYTKWNGKKIEYWHDPELSVMMQVAGLKNVLPHPTGTYIELKELSYV